MCRHTTVPYNCGHCHQILEISPICYHLDRDENASGCCEATIIGSLLHSNTPLERHQSEFRCPGCRKPQVAEAVETHITLMVGGAIKVAEWGNIRVVFRAGEKKGEQVEKEKLYHSGARKVEGSWWKPAVGPLPEAPARLVYDGVQVLQRNSTNDGE